MAIKFSDITGGGIPFGNTAGRPANPTSGKLYSNGEAARLELYTATGWQNIVQEVPGVASITGTYSESANSGTITISGTNFVSGAIASAIGTNGVEVLASSTTYNSLVQLTAVFTGLSNAYEPYDIKVTNPSNLFGLIPDVLYVNASPVWTTASGSLGSFNEKVSISVSATATDESDITYSLAQGSSLPTGLTLNSSSGLISGTLPDIASTTTYTFTINASDGANPAVPRAFSITSNLVDLYAFTSHTFTTAGVTGYQGPTLTQTRSAYSATSWANTYLNMTTQGIQEWTVPASGNYYIDAYGAGGGGVSGGTGARIADTFSLTAGEVIRILVGQYGNGGTSSQAAGGGGGTFVLKSGGNTNSQILVIAGGGGASEGDSSGRTIGNASTGTSGVDGYNSATLNVNGGGSGGVNGNGGNSAQSDNCGGGGGGFFTNGQDSPTWGNIGGKSFINGGLGGQPSAVGNYGGFGGGGEGQHQAGGGGAGAGGGYSGGGGGDNVGGSQGGGGGSYYANGLNINRVLSSSGTSRNTQGQVIITKL